MEQKLGDYLANLNDGWKEDFSLLKHLLQRLADEIETWHRFPQADSTNISSHWTVISSKLRENREILDAALTLSEKNSIPEEISQRLADMFANDQEINNRLKIIEEFGLVSFGGDASVVWEDSYQMIRQTLSAVSAFITSSMKRAETESHLHENGSGFGPDSLYQHFVLQAKKNSDEVSPPPFESIDAFGQSDGE